MSGPSFTMADLQRGAKRLSASSGLGSESKSDAKSSSDHSNSAAIKSLESLYDRYDGDLDLIFAELRCSPVKAKKAHHRPSNAEEFAKKYLEGYYSVISNDDTDASDEKCHK